MFSVSDDDFNAFIKAEFDRGEGAGEITEREFIEVLCVHFYLDDEERTRLKDSHEALIRQLVRLCPDVLRGKRLGPRGVTKTLIGLDILDYRLRRGGEDQAMWSEIDSFLQTKCRFAEGLFVPVSTLRDQYNGYKKKPLRVTTTGICKQILSICPGTRRSVHRIRGKNFRCLDGIGLKENTTEGAIS